MYYTWCSSCHRIWKFRHLILQHMVLIQEKNYNYMNHLPPLPERSLDCRLGLQLQGYNPITPRPMSCRPFVHCLLVLPVISRGAARQATWETSVSEGWNYGWEMAGQFGLWFWLPHKLQCSFTCHKSATWDRQLYFPSEGRHAVDFFTQKIWRLRPGLNPWSERSLLW
jgi:hypothetical protein